MFDFAEDEDREATQEIWSPTQFAPMFHSSDLCQGVSLFRHRTHILFDRKRKILGLGIEGQRSRGTHGDLTVVASLPQIYPEWLGDRTFQETHHVRFPYICGEMANGIASPQMVIAAAQAGFLAFYGAAGLSLETVATAIRQIKHTLDGRYSWGSNLIHSPLEPALEQALVDFYIQNNVTRVSASAYMRLVPTLVQYACTGLSLKNGRPVRRNYLFAKISRPEVARQFMAPAPEKILAALVKEGRLTPSEAKIAQSLPLSEDITVEADSAGHTDNQVLPAILSSILEMRNQIQSANKYLLPIRVGAAGGIGSPNGAAAAFAMGAAYILTGSVNQSCVESNLHPAARKMLETMSFGDTMMCAASDMFEQGVKLQVLKRGTLYGVRANWLYELYRTHDSLETLCPQTLERLEKEIFRKPLADVWAETKAFWEKRDPTQIIRAAREPKHLMALLFRYYLGLSSKWAINGTEERKIDYQIWCGPAQAAFNHWTRDTFLAKVENRNVALVALNILEGAAQILRAGQLRSFGVPIPGEAFEYRAQRLSSETALREEREPLYA